MTIPLHDQLRNLYELSLIEKIPYKTMGICNNLDLTCTQNDDLLDLILSWPDRNVRGHTSYPIEGSGIAYVLSVKAQTLWKNPRRLALLLYLVEAS